MTHAPGAAYHEACDALKAGDVAKAESLLPHIRRTDTGASMSKRSEASCTETAKRNLALEDVLRDLIRAADRARVKRLPVGIVRATNAAIERCFDALDKRRKK